MLRTKHNFSSVYFAKELLRIGIEANHLVSLEGSKSCVQFHALLADYKATAATVVTKRTRLLLAITVLANCGCLELRHATSDVGIVAEIDVPG